jgi:putative 4-mercaptohistidine N1-methyltranferase
MENNPYESTKLLGEYLLFHYGKNEEVLPWSNGPVEALNFTKRTVDSLIDEKSFNADSRALDVGCAVGASSFVLGKYFGDVLGVDFSQNFIDAANTLKENNSLSYTYLVEGDSFKKAEAVPESTTGNISFAAGDAMNLDSSLANYDLVHAANLICRLSSPQKFFTRIPDLVRQGGQLLLATPFTWLEEYTPRNNWIGSGDSKEKLVEKLSPWFQLEYEEDLPFLIREHRRKYQYSISWGTRWRRL